VQSWRLPRAPHADCAWQVCPLPWQHTAPPEQSVADAQTVAVPDGQVPLWHVAVPPPAPPSVAARQHALPDAQSVGAPQTCAVPDGHVVWHVLAAPAEPRQHWPVMQSAVPMHEGGGRQVP
jgi:hypothetical protein